MNHQEKSHQGFPFAWRHQETGFANHTSHDNYHRCWLTEYFQTSWRNGDFCDFTIYCRTKEFRLHRLILASQSEKFRQIFKSPNPISSLVLTYYDEEVVEAIVNYLYTRQITLETSKQKQIVECAAELGIDELLEGVEKLPRTFNIENVVERYLVTKRNGIYSENRECLRYMGEWLPDVSQSMEFLQMSVDDLCAALNSEEIRQLDEIEILKAAIRWLRYDYSKRKQHLKLVLSNIKFSLINRDELNHEIARNRSILEVYSEASRVYNRSESRITSTSEDSFYEQKSANDQHRLVRPCILAVYSRNVYSTVPGEFCTNNVINPGIWKLATVLPEFKNHPSIAYFNDHIYVIGGADKVTKRSSRFAMKYNIESGQWDEIAPMQESRSYASAVVMGGKIYVVGGRNENKTILNSMEVYDTEHDKWMYASPASGHCVGAAVTEHLNRLYRFGGDNSKQTLCLAEVYDPERDKWLLRTPLQEDSAFGGVIEIRSRLYMIGGAKYRKGYNVLPSVRVYDPVQDLWSCESELQTPRCDHGVVNIGTKFYVFSGFRDHSKSVDTIECYDTSLGTTVKGTITCAPMAGSVVTCVVPPYEW